MNDKEQRFFEELQFFATNTTVLRDVWMNSDAYIADCTIEHDRVTFDASLLTDTREFIELSEMYIGLARHLTSAFRQLSKDISVNVPNFYFVAPVDSILSTYNTIEGIPIVVSCIAETIDIVFEPGDIGAIRKAYNCFLSCRWNHWGKNEYIV